MPSHYAKTEKKNSKSKEQGKPKEEHMGHHSESKKPMGQKTESLHKEMIAGLDEIAKKGINMNSRNPRIKKLR